MLLNVMELIARFPLAAECFMAFNHEHEFETWENGGYWHICRTIVNGKIRYIATEIEKQD